MVKRKRYIAWIVWQSEEENERDRVKEEGESVCSRNARTAYTFSYYVDVRIRSLSRFSFYRRNEKRERNLLHVLFARVKAIFVEGECVYDVGNECKREHERRTGREEEEAPTKERQLNAIAFGVWPCYSYLFVFPFVSCFLFSSSIVSLTHTLHSTSLPIQDAVLKRNEQ